MVKKLIRVVVVLVVLLILAVVVAWVMIDSIAKVGVEKGGSYALGVKTTLDDMSISLLRGRLAMDGLNVANPEGFKSDHLMHSGRFELAIDSGSLFSDSINVTKFELDGLDMNVEQKAGGSNVSKVIDNLKRLGSPEEKEKDSGGKKVKVDRIVIRNVKAHFHLISGIKPVTVVVPEIVLTDVTSDNAAGVAVSQLAGRIVPAILASVLENGKGVVPADLLKGLNGELTGLAEAVAGQTGKLIEQVGGDLKDVVGKEGEKVVKDVTKGVSDLLKGLPGTKKEPEKD